MAFYKPHRPALAREPAIMPTRFECHLPAFVPKMRWSVDARPANRLRMNRLADIHDEYEFLEADDRYRLLIELGRGLPEMPEALKIPATMVRGCSASVWVYPAQRDNGTLNFMADSNAAITKGIIALVLLTVQNQCAADILKADIEGELAPFDLKNQLSSNRTQGIPNMIALIRETAARYA
jgi:cysteine desulfuration protein SufE